MWAERGLIHIEDSRDNSYEAIAVKECLERLNGLNEMIGRSKKGGMASRSNSFTNYMDEITDIQRMIDDTIDICRKAREQGMPTDASARRDLKRRQKTQVSIPKDFNMPL
jgi:hypothetical protein